MGTIRGALIGHGFIAERGHLPAYAALGSERFQIDAIADSEPTRLALAQGLHPNARVYSDYRELLAKEKYLDFVDVTTPPNMHARIAHAALDRGLHVLCEKPLATSFADAKSMLDHAAKAKRVLFPSHNYKHAPVIKAVRSVIDSGEIGDVRLVTLHTFRNTHARGVNEFRPDWRRERAYSGGGIAMDHGSHTFYLAFDWLGEYPTAISATMNTLGDFDTEDNFSCSITFPHGMASAHLTWTAGMRKVMYTIHGDKGAIRVEDDDVEITTMDTSSGALKWNTRKESVSSNWMDASHVTWFGSLFSQFANAIDKKEYVGKEATDSLRCIELIETAYASARDGSRQLPLGSAVVASLDSRRSGFFPPANDSEPALARKARHG